MNFKDLWQNHPANEDDLTPCHDAMGVPNFESQCAIRMGICLSKSGLDFSDFNGVRCWFHPEYLNHTLRVEELVEYLKKKLPKSIFTTKTRRSWDSPLSEHGFEGLTGIVVFQNFWGDGNRGDHIDLWDGEEMTYGDNDYFERSEKVYFWNID